MMGFVDAGHKVLARLLNAKRCFYLTVFCVSPISGDLSLLAMPFWKKRDSTGDADANNGNGSNGESAKPKEKVNYKARLEHKQYLVRSYTLHTRKAIFFPLTIS